MLNQAMQVVYNILCNPNKENHDHSILRCRAFATYAWPLAHYSLCNVLITTFLLILLVSKGGILKNYPVPVEEKILENANFVTIFPMKKFAKNVMFILWIELEHLHNVQNVNLVKFPSVSNVNANNPDFVWVVVWKNLV